MNLKISGFFGAATLAAIVMTPLPAAADSDNMALVQQDVGCFLFIPAAFPVALFTNDSIDVSTNGGNTQLTCHFDIPLGSEPDNVVKASGFDCGVLTKDGFAITTNSRASWTPGGKAHLSCKIKKD